MEENNSRERRLMRAKKRLEEIKRFYAHVAAYLIVNTVFTIVCYQYDIIIRIFGGVNITNNMSEVGGDNYPLWGIWGVLLLVDAVKVFGFRKLFSRDWEERKINEFMKNNK